MRSDWEQFRYKLKWIGSSRAADGSTIIFLLAVWWFVCLPYACLCVTCFRKGSSNQHYGYVCNRHDPQSAHARCWHLLYYSLIVNGAPPLRKVCTCPIMLFALQTLKLYVWFFFFFKNVFSIFFSEAYTLIKIVSRKVLVIWRVFSCRWSDVKSCSKQFRRTSHKAARLQFTPGSTVWWMGQSRSNIHYISMLASNCHKQRESKLYGQVNIRF